VAGGSKKVAELVGEIAAASSEQAQGIEQINKAVSEMDRVVQQNAASAEESAAAAEEMDAQAEQMKDFVGKLIVVIGRNGHGNGIHRTKSLPDSRGLKERTLVIGRQVKSNLNKALPKPVGKGNGRNLVVRGFKEVRPEQLISLKNGEFEEF
jgi:methyl-accepting chemotaxis protein